MKGSLFSPSFVYLKSYQLFELEINYRLNCTSVCCILWHRSVSFILKVFLLMRSPLGRPLKQV